MRVHMQQLDGVHHDDRCDDHRHNRCGDHHHNLRGGHRDLFHNTCDVQNVRGMVLHGAVQREPLRDEDDEDDENDGDFHGDTLDDDVLVHSDLRGDQSLNDGEGNDDLVHDEVHDDHDHDVHVHGHESKLRD